MDRKNAVLEYCVAETNGATAPEWRFRFKGADGQTLMESATVFNSPAKAQDGFVAMIKLIATNQYAVECPGLPNSGG